MFFSPIAYTLHLPTYMKDTQAAWFGEGWYLTEADKPLKMFYHSGTLESPTRLSVPGDGEFLGFFFNLGNAFNCSFAGEDRPTRSFKRDQYTLVYMPDAGCDYDMPQGSACALWIHYPSYLFRLGVDYYPFLKDLLAAVEEERTYVVSFDAMGVPSEILRVINSILYSNHAPATRDTFFYYSLSSLMFKCFEQIDALHRETPEWVDSYELEKVNKVKDHIHAHLAEHLTLSDLADQAGVAPRTLSRMFRKNCDKSVMDFVMGVRMDKAQELLEHSDMSIERIGKAVGYRVPSHFTRAFVRRFGYSPRDFRTIM